MSHNDNIPQRSARRHAPALIAIIAALTLAGLALVVFGGLGGQKDDGVVREVAPATSGSPQADTTGNSVPQPTTAPAKP